MCFHVKAHPDALTLRLYQYLNAVSVAAPRRGKILIKSEKFASKPAHIRTGHMQQIPQALLLLLKVLPAWLLSGPCLSFDTLLRSFDYSWIILTEALVFRTILGRMNWE